MDRLPARPLVHGVAALALVATLAMRARLCWSATPETVSLRSVLRHPPAAAGRQQ